MLLAYDGAGLQLLVIAVVLAIVSGDLDRRVCTIDFIRMRSVGGFLGAVTLRVRIVAIRIIIVRGAGIHRVQDDAEEMTLDAEKQIASADKSFLGGFSAAHDQKDAIGLNGEDYGVSGGHDGRGVENYKF